MDDERVASIEAGLLVLLGVSSTDRPEDAERLAAKISTLRIFDDDRRRMNRDVGESGGAILAVPQFTLLGYVRGGRRPDYTHAADPESGRRLFDAFCGALRGRDLAVQAGRFGAHMRIAMEADGPVTIVLTTDGWAEGEVRR